MRRSEARQREIFTRVRFGSNFAAGLVLLGLVFSGAGRAGAEEWAGADLGWFVAGGVSGFALHEAAHAATAVAFGVRPRLGVRRRPIPFLVVRYNFDVVQDRTGHIRYLDRNGNPLRHGAEKQFAIVSAGIDSQEITSELILSLDPNVRVEPHPYLKGVLAFDLLTAAGYALFGRNDPNSDVRGMAEALDVNDRVIGALVLLPAAVDAYRYYFPESVWAPWTSRSAKGYLFGLSLRW